MNALGTDLAHVVGASMEATFKGSFPFLNSITAQGTAYFGQYGRAAKCHLTQTDCARVLQLDTEFTYKRDDQGKLTFGFFTGITARGQTKGGFALLDLYNAISDKKMTKQTRQWLALLSSVDFGISLKLVKAAGAGAVESFEMKIDATLRAKNLPLDNNDDLVDGNCNVVCQYLHKALGATGSAAITGTLKVVGKDVTVSLTAAIKDAQLVLKSGSGDSPDITLINLGFSVFFTNKNKEFKLELSADIDVNDNLKLTGGIGFGVAKDDAGGKAITATFHFGLRKPYYEAFGSAVSHVTGFNFNFELKGKSLPNLEATGELCIGQRAACQACAEAAVPAGAMRSSILACRGPVYVDVIIRVRLPGKAPIDGGGDSIPADSCKPASAGGGGWELFIQASVEAANGVGPLSRIQNAVGEQNSNSAVDDRLGVFAAVKFVVSLTVGPSRFKLTAEAQLHKVALPPKTTNAQSKTCDMICNLCHKVLENADAGSYVFIKGEIGVTVKPFSLTVAVGAGFKGTIVFPDKGITLTQASLHRRK